MAVFLSFVVVLFEHTISYHLFGLTASHFTYARNSHLGRAAGQMPWRASPLQCSRKTAASTLPQCLDENPARNKFQSWFLPLWIETITRNILILAVPISLPGWSVIPQ
jgi:hypothetical protein